MSTSEVLARVERVRKWADLWLEYHHIRLDFEAILAQVERDQAELARLRAGWQSIETLPEHPNRPGRIFVRVEGSQEHSGVTWHREWSDVAFTRPGPVIISPDDIERICRFGGIDPSSLRVTHWMPAYFPPATPSPQQAPPHSDDMNDKVLKRVGAMKWATALFKEAQEVCGVYHATAVGKVARAVANAATPAPQQAPSPGAMDQGPAERAAGRAEAFAAAAQIADSFDEMNGYGAGDAIRALAATPPGAQKPEE